MTDQSHWVKDVSDVFESLEHGAILQKFVAKYENKDGSTLNGAVLPSVEVHGFITSSGEFIITNEKFVRESDKEK